MSLLNSGGGLHGIFVLPRVARPIGSHDIHKRGQLLPWNYQCQAAKLTACSRVLSAAKESAAEGQEFESLRARQVVQ
jgi:hypothetical protein